MENKLLSTKDQLIRSRDSDLQKKNQKKTTKETNKQKKKVIKKRHYYQFFIKETCLTKTSVLILVRIEP